jgi:hypothetical protein
MRFEPTNPNFKWVKASRVQQCLAAGLVTEIFYCRFTERWTSPEWKGLNWSASYAPATISLPWAVTLWIRHFTATMALHMHTAIHLRDSSPQWGWLLCNWALRYDNWMWSRHQDKRWPRPQFKWYLHSWKAPCNVKTYEQKNVKMYITFLRWHTVSHSHGYITTGSQSASVSWCQAPIWDTRPIFPLLPLIIFRQLRVCWCGEPSLTRSRVCSLQFL